MTLVDTFLRSNTVYSKVIIPFSKTQNFQNLLAHFKYKFQSFYFLKKKIFFNLRNLTFDLNNIWKNTKQALYGILEIYYL